MSVPELVLVTGGAGFVGSHVVDELVETGRRVRVIDLLHPAAHDGPPDWLNTHAEYRWGDISDPTFVTDAVDGVDAVTHQAAMVGLGVDFRDVEAHMHASRAQTPKTGIARTAAPKVDTV